MSSPTSRAGRKVRRGSAGSSVLLALLQKQSLSDRLQFLQRLRRLYVTDDSRPVDLALIRRVDGHIRDIKKSLRGAAP